jgi:hypothetical protein
LDDRMSFVVVKIIPCRLRRRLSFVATAKKSSREKRRGLCVGR